MKMNRLNTNRVYEKVFISVVLSLLFLSVFFIISSCSNKQQISSSVNISAILPLTGSSGYIGDSLRKGMELAKDNIKDMNINLSFEDSMGDPKTGLSAYEKIINDKKADIIITALSSVSKAIIPLVDKDKIPLLTTVVSAEGITDQNPYVFRFFTRADVDAKIMADYAYSKLNFRSIAIIHVQDDFGISYANVFKRTFEGHGGKIVIIESFLPSESNFYPILEKIKPLKIDGVYVLSYANNLALIPRQMKELGIKKTILSIGTIAQDFVIKQAGGSLEGTYYTTNAFDTFNPTTKEMKDFVASYQQKYGKVPEYFEVFGYDAINLIAKAKSLKVGGGTRSEIQKGLLSIENYNGVAGKISVTSNREVNLPVIIGKITNGQALPLVSDGE